MILIKAGQISKEEYFVSQANYLLKMEGDPIRWDREIKGIIAARKANQEDSETDFWESTFGLRNGHQMKRSTGTVLK